jgi:hypothetical protein
MPKSKIKSISEGKEWKGNKGIVYFFDVEMEDGYAGQLMSSKNPPSYLKVGNEIQYEKGEHNGKPTLKRIDQQSSTDNWGVTKGVAFKELLQKDPRPTREIVADEKFWSMVKWTAEKLMEL